MATVQEDIVKILEVENGIQTYPDHIPNDGTAVYPSVVYNIINTKQFRHMEGNGFSRPYVQLDVWDEPDRYDRCVATAILVKSLLDLNQTDFELCFIDDERGDIPDESGYRRIILQFVILK